MGLTTNYSWFITFMGASHICKKNVCRFKLHGNLRQGIHRRRTDQGVFQDQSWGKRHVWGQKWTFCVCCKPTLLGFLKVSGGSAESNCWKFGIKKDPCVNLYIYIHLELQTTRFLWLEWWTQSLLKKWLFHQTSIKKWLFRVPGKPECFGDFCRIPSLLTTI